MNVRNIIAIGFIFVCTALGWFILGGALSSRTHARSEISGSAVDATWGPPMQQQHPVIYYLSPTSGKGRKQLQPEESRVNVKLSYEPKKKGLLWHRTYLVDFAGEYTVANPTPVTQTLYVLFHLPAENTSYYDFSYKLGNSAPTQKAPENGALTEAIVLPPGGSQVLRVTYRARGTDEWGYQFGNAGRVRNFLLTMQTDFSEIDFPLGTGSPTERAADGKGWQLIWSYPDVLAAQSIGMGMPKALNPGPVAARIAFFAPVSLLFFFAVLLLLGMVRGVRLHPMHYFFIAAGFFAFQLLFAYLVDLAPLMPSFAIAAAVSLVLVGLYTHAVSKGRLTWIAVPAQFAYMVLFSYSFFFDGLTGLTITIGAVLTLALLMLVTAKIDWTRKFYATPPPLPTRPAPTV